MKKACWITLTYHVYTIKSPTFYDGKPFSKGRKRLVITEVRCCLHAQIKAGMLIKDVSVNLENKLQTAATRPIYYLNYIAVKILGLSTGRLAVRDPSTA